MFLKEIENKEVSKIFQKFSDLNAECKIEFILTSEDLVNFSFHFERGMNMYETNLFEEKKYSSFYSKEGIRKDVDKMEDFINIEKEILLEISNEIKVEKEEISKFNIKGDFQLIYKKKKTYIKCNSDVYLYNKIFGKFILKQGKYYSFNLKTLGRDPKLKRNNMFISKNRVYQLIEEKKIRNPEELIKEIAENI